MDVTLLCSHKAIDIRLGEHASEALSMAAWKNQNHSWESRTEWGMHKVLVPVLDTMIIGIGLVGHSLVIFVLLKRRRQTGSRLLYATDIFLLNLSMSDILLLLSLPFHTAAHGLGNWPFGSFLCKAVSFLGVACNTGSAFTLAALALLRYLIVARPTWVYRYRMRQRIRISVVLLWAPAVALASPQFAIRTVGSYSTILCFVFLSDLNKVVYSTALFLFGFALPLLVIVLMYAKLYLFLRRTSMQGQVSQLERYQKQVTQTTFLLVVVFTVCWLPAYIVMFCLVGNSKNRNTFLTVLARVMASSSSMVNPLLYAFVSKKFRRELLCKTRCRDHALARRFVCCPERRGDTVQPFDPADLDTPPPERN